MHPLSKRKEPFNFSSQSFRVTAATSWRRRKRYILICFVFFIIFLSSSLVCFNSLAFAVPLVCLVTTGMPPQGPMFHVPKGQSKPAIRWKTLFEDNGVTTALSTCHDGKSSYHRDVNDALHQTAGGIHSNILAITNLMHCNLPKLIQRTSFTGINRKSRIACTSDIWIGYKLRTSEIINSAGAAGFGR